ncbi:unnamed protein product [Prunus armeniaca]
MFKVIGNGEKGTTIIYCDNMSTIKMLRKLVMHGRSKYIDVRFHFMRDLCKDGKIELQYCKSREHVADIMTNIKASCVREAEEHAWSFLNSTY